MGWDGGGRGEDHPKGSLAAEDEDPEVVNLHETNAGGEIGKDHSKGELAAEDEDPEVANVHGTNAGGRGDGWMAAAPDPGITVRKWIGVRCQCA